MKAAIFREHGGSEVLTYEEVPDPEVGPFEVLVRVRAAALNHLDLFVRNGLPGRKIPMPHIPGCEGAGEVVKVGSCVDHIREGEQVIVTPMWSCNRCEYCLNHRESMCLSAGMMGVERNGCCAELVSAPSEVIYSIPSNLSFNEAASVPLVFVTAWHMLVARAAVQPGETVLVQAAGSGVGIAAIQIARLFGAQVIATAGSDEKLEKARQLGAEILINYAKTNFAEEIRKITAKRGVDIIIEHTGAENWEKNILSLSRNGRLVTCGATSGFDARTDLRYIFSRQLSILGSYMGSKKDMLELLRFVREGKLRPVIDSIFPLSEIRAAEQRMEERAVFGKIVIQP
jgi:NADPH:quinone reductase-like Zn-dependent oxidoreductase